MSLSDDLQDRIIEVANKARRVTSGAESIEQHDLSSLVKALEAIGADDTPASHSHRGLRFTQLKSPGCGG